ncbi:immunity 22 family protein [Streptococcus australis]|uniref:immunity 22 family protein n=1 Tax=Streptococcus australis TaxID=113107 RepID=UPI0018990440|nr:immunity 22 family protein [Streptococcus australis]MDB8651037.1 immunity 22 family protein [Streptococcus australis]
METENIVSIWIGNFATKLDLDEFINLKYDEEGEVVPSLFYNQYNIDIDDIDDYLIEKEVFETSFTNLFDMLKEASYNNIIVNNLKQKGINPNIEPNNALILIYNYQFDSNTLRTINTEFIATVEYK